jgi:SNF2 family DNA or RNA helicase
VGKLTNIIPGSSWPTEIEKHTDFTYMRLFRSPKTSSVPDKIKDMDHDIYLINYELFARHIKDIIDRDYGCIFFDESYKIKNIKTSWTKAAIKLAKTDACIGIATGFPVSEHLAEIWTQAHVTDNLDNPQVPDNYYKFLNKYFYQWRFGWSIKKGKMEQLMKDLEPTSVFVSVRDCYDLPPRLYRYIYISATEEQTIHMNNLKNDFSTTIDGFNMEFKHILPTLQKMQQICSGFIYTRDKNDIKKFYTPKLEVLINTLDGISEKAIIWCKYNEEINQILSMLPPTTKNVTLSVTSDLSNEQKTFNLDRFKDPKSPFRFLVTTYDLMESGETLVVAPYSIHYGYTWSNAMTTNAKRRVYRRGAEIHTKIIYIHVYIKDSIEEIIINTLRRKKNMQTELKKWMSKW